MDRCALFVDAGYVLADGAMAVHGTRHRESVSWNYAGLLQFLGSVARDRTGLPLLRCYWYEATVEGRRSAEHDALADLPGVKLRLGRMRPGRREGVESEIHRDLTTLARNGALQDALVVSAEEDLAQVIADVQDLGLRVTLVHITVDGNWTISRALRQECDDIVEIGEAHLRPYVELVVGAEPLHDDERQSAGAYPGRALTNGHGSVGPLGHQQALPAGSSPAPPEIYTAPVIAEYQRTAQPAVNGQPGAQQPASGSGPAGMASPEQQPRQPRRSQNAQPAQAGNMPPAAGATPGIQQPAGLATPPAAPAQAQAAQASGPMPAQPGMTQPAAAPGMAGQPVPQQAPAVQQPLPAPGQRRGRNTGADQAGAGQDATGMPAVPLPGQQAARAAPMGQQAVPGQQAVHGQQVAPDQQAVPGQQPGPGQQAMPSQQVMPGQGQQMAPGQPGQQMVPGQPPQQAVPGQQTMPGQPGMQAPPGQQSHPGMAPHHGGPAGSQVPHAPQVSQPPQQPIYPVPPAYQGPGPDAMAGPGGGPGGPGQTGPHQPPAGQQPAPTLAGQPAPMPGQPGPPGTVPMQQGPGGPPGPGGPAGPPAQQGRGAARAPAATGRFTRGPQNQQAVQAQQFPGPPADQPEVAAAPHMPPQQGMYAGQQPASSHLVPQQTSVSLADAVQAAHGEGFNFGQSVARDAPALWLEAVLARKPRMPSDLEARLLQDSALPIDSLLHDEVRHALRRGFWDALERARH